MSIVNLEQVNVWWKVNSCFQKQISVRLKLFIEVEDFFLFRFTYTVLFVCLYLLKTSEKQKFSDSFEGYRKRPATWNGIRTTQFGHMRRFARFGTIYTIQKT